MKMRRDHVVPLSTQAKAVLKAAATIRTAPDADALLFPGFTRHGALSENALIALLARCGFYGRQTAHGFRAAFSTWAHEKAEAHPDVIEACLAHVVPGVRGKYNRAMYLRQRHELLQAWADQLALLRFMVPALTSAGNAVPRVAMVAVGRSASAELERMALVRLMAHWR